MIPAGTWRSARIRRDLPPARTNYRFKACSAIADCLGHCCMIEHFWLDAVTLVQFTNLKARDGNSFTIIFILFSRFLRQELVVAMKD